METKSLIGGLIVGAALGAAAGILLAPSSGEKTRRRLVKGSLKLTNDVVGSLEDSIESLREQFNEKIESLTSKGKDVLNHVNEKVKV